MANNLAQVNYWGFMLVSMIIFSQVSSSKSVTLSFSLVFSYRQIYEKV